MAKNTPRVTDGVYEYFDKDEGKVTISFDIAQEPEAWLDELKRLKTVRVIYTEPKSGFKFVYSCYKNAQTITTINKAGVKKDVFQGSFWVGRKHIGGKLNRIYIGKNSNMTASRLAEVAIQISQATMSLKSRL